jgi:two-component system response regulator AtoC
VIERGIVVCETDQLGVECLPDKFRGVTEAKGAEIIPSDCLSLKQAAELLERNFIQRALQTTGGNRSRAARLLEISHRSLLYKLKEYGMV